MRAQCSVNRYASENRSVSFLLCVNFRFTELPDKSEVFFPYGTIAATACIPSPAWDISRLPWGYRVGTPILMPLPGSG